MGEQKLSTKLKLIYGAGSVGEGIGYCFYYTWYVFFLTTIAGINSVIVGTISMVAILWDAITDPLIGTWSDNTKNKHGRRRPFLFVGSVFFGISLILNYTNVNMSMGGKIAFFIIAGILYWGFLTSCVIPHVSLGAEITTSYTERNDVRGFANGFMNLGQLIASSATLMLVSFFAKRTGSENMGWILASACFGVVAILGYQIAAWGLKGKEPENPNIQPGAVVKKVNFKEVLSAYGKCFSNRPLRILYIVDLLFNFIVGSGTALSVFVYTFSFGLSEETTSLVYLIQGIALVVAVIPITALSHKMSKKSILMMSNIAYILSGGIMLLIPYSFPVLVLSTLLYAVGNAAHWCIIYSMLYDTTAIAEYKTGEIPTGVYVSLYGFLMKVGTAFAMFIVGFGLDAIGFDESAAVQAAGVGSRLVWLNYGLYIVIFVLAVIATSRYTLSKVKYDKLMKAIEDKKADRPVDISGLEDVL